MNAGRCGLRTVLALCAAVLVVSSAGATTLIRMGLDDLVATNDLVVVGKVIDTHSRWNAEGTFILTDVTVAVDDVLKGAFAAEDIVFTVMGGTVGDKTVVIVAGPEIDIDRDYVFFLSPSDLPGAPAALSVRDLAQGTFDVVATTTGVRAVSQASQHPLLSDWRGTKVAPGGTDGIEINDFVRQVRDLADAQ